MLEHASQMHHVKLLQKFFVLPSVWFDIKFGTLPSGAALNAHITDSLRWDEWIVGQEGDQKHPKSLWMWDFLIL